MGFASDIDSYAEELLKTYNQIMNPQEEIEDFLSSKNSSKKVSKYSGYTNPLTGSNHIYTREEVDSMTNDEFSNLEKEIMSQIKALKGMPRNSELEEVSKTSGDVIWVNSYTRSDGTQVRGYYRSR